MVRVGFFILALLAGATASAQTSTTDCTTIGSVTHCKSQRDVPLDYAAALGVAQDLVPDYQEQRERQLRIRQLELENRLMERQNTLQAAPGFNEKQCRNAAKSALANNDLVLARDVLNACVVKN